MNGQNRWTSRALAIVLGTLCGGAMAGDNPAPLGLELAVATCERALADSSGGGGDLSEIGTNNVSNGRYLEGSAAGLHIEGLLRLNIACDGGDRVIGVSFAYRKDPANFKRLYDGLARKYQVEKTVDPEHGDHYVRFRHRETMVELLAPYQGGEMFLEYATAEFRRAAEAARAAKGNERR